MPVNERRLNSVPSLLNHFSSDGKSLLARMSITRYILQLLEIIV
jgi:hypothetical protein